MMTTTHTNFFFRIGATARRGINAFKRFEARVTFHFRARFPKFGAVLARGMFLIAKIAFVALSAMVSFYLVAMLLMLAALIYGLMHDKPEEKTMEKKLAEERERWYWDLSPEERAKVDPFYF
jgi:fatty acid desaturase